MASCLGIYIDKNIIKYAKVAKNKEDLKVEAFGIKIYTNLRQTIDQIISETFSFKIPISVNMSEETYNYFYMSDLLNKKDLNKAINTEFDSFCYERDINANALDSKYTLVNDTTDKGKIKVIHVSIDKIKINKILQELDGIRVGTIAPMPISIANIAPLKAKENVAILNIEDTTTITLITGQNVYDVQSIPVGSKEILDKINEVENSYAKAYEICKNSTIYTMEGRELQEKENEHLQNIIPTLYTIASQIKEMISTTLFKINKVYITGTASAINNIDLYFEELLGGTKCEILKPFFIEDSPKINIKDYIEVNSAIALALQGLDYGIKDINFKKDALKEKLSILTKEVSFGKDSDKKDPFKSAAKRELNSVVPNFKMWAVRSFVFTVVFLVIYIGISSYLKIQIDKKQDEIQEVTDDINAQITAIKKDKDKVNEKASKYTALANNLRNASTTLTEKSSYKNILTTFLNKIIYNIPREVQLTLIENPSGRTIRMEAQSTRYEQLAYFKSILREEAILEPTTVVSSEATKTGDIVKITIEGELP